MQGTSLPWRPAVGLVLAFATGVACRQFDIPSPAPPALLGALLVLSMTIGYQAVDRLMDQPAVHEADCGGPSGGTRHLPASTRGLADMSAVPAGPGQPLPHSGPQVQAGAAAFVQWCALLCLCAAYLQGGLDKLLAFQGAVSEMRHFELPLPEITATLVIAMELGCSGMILTGRGRWFGAFVLGAFTVLASLIANRFWEVSGPERFPMENGFFEHLGLAGGFLLVGVLDLARVHQVRSLSGAHGSP